MFNEVDEQIERSLENIEFHSVAHSYSLFQTRKITAPALNIAPDQRVHFFFPFIRIRDRTDQAFDLIDTALVRDISYPQVQLTSAIRRAA